MSEKHLAERLMYPLPDGWRDDPEQVAALKEIWPTIITKNKELIDAEIASLRAQLDEARAAFTQIREHTKNVFDDDLIVVIDMIAEDFLDPSKRAPLRALLSESKT